MVFIPNYLDTSTGDTTASGNGILSNFNSYASDYFEAPIIDDDRHNPKCQSRWFREMVCAILPAREGQVRVSANRFPENLPFRVRAGPFFEQEWKMKAYKQANS